MNSGNVFAQEKVNSCDYDRLQINSQPVIERHIDALSGLIDEYAAVQNKYQFQLREITRQKAQQQSYLAKVKAENEARIAQGKAPQPEEDLSKNPLFKNKSKPSRLESILVSQQMNTHCGQLSAVSAQDLQKLYVAQAIHVRKE